MTHVRCGDGRMRCSGFHYENIVQVINRLARTNRNTFLSGLHSYVITWHRRVRYGRYRQQIRRKRRYLCTRMHGFIDQKIIISIFTAVRTLNLTKCPFRYYFTDRLCWYLCRRNSAGLNCIRLHATASPTTRTNRLRKCKGNVSSISWLTTHVALCVSMTEWTLPVIIPCESTFSYRKTHFCPVMIEIQLKAVFLINYMLLLIKKWVSFTIHIGWVSCHRGMTRPHVADGGDGLQIWRLAANI
jgi:hypothetical protein